MTARPAASVMRRTLVVGIVGLTITAAGGAAVFADAAPAGRIGQPPGGTDQSCDVMPLLAEHRQQRPSDHAGSASDNNTQGHFDLASARRH